MELTYSMRGVASPLVNAARRRGSVVVSLLLGLSLVVVAESGCVRSDTAACAWGAVCPSGMVCYDPLTICVFPSQLDACQGAADRESCSFPGAGGGTFWCLGGVCVPRPVCGNAELEPGEECDCGDDADAELPVGCDGVNAAAADACRPENCLLPACGDGIVDSQESCDDSNIEAGDGCSPVCLDEVCGNAIIDPGEACDDGTPLEDGDGCSADCVSDESCGNGHVDYVLGEQCDDGNFGSHDGCSSGCTMETPSWTEWTDAAIPRASAAAVWDSLRGRVVMSGGKTSEGYTDETWQLSGGLWTQVTADATPSARGKHALAFDPSRDLLVMFGGWNGSSRYGDTWVFDGTTWSEVTAAVAPSSRDNHKMVYDAGLDRVVLFGGWDGVQLLEDTWEFDPATLTWEDRTADDPTPPGARSSHGIAYVPGQGTYVFGGRGNDTSGFVKREDLWLRDGSRLWDNVKPTPAPDGRSSLGMVYDALNDRLVVFGGWADSIYGELYSSELWFYPIGAAGWTLVNQASPPPGRSNHLQVYDSLSDRTVVFGGLDHGGRLGDTWELQGTTWAPGTPVRAPMGRENSAVVYDSLRGRAVLMAGVRSGVWFGDTWAFDGVRWTELAVSTPLPPVNSHAAAFDPNNDQIVVFGGHWDYAIDQTWIFDGVGWQSLSTAHSPPPRTSHAMLYDPQRQRAVLFGGRAKADGTYLNDTWEFDGTDWSQRDTLVAPEARVDHAMAYDAGRHCVVIFGGDGVGGRLTDTWELDDTGWRQVLTAIGPQSAVSPAAGYNLQRQRIVMHTADSHPDSQWLDAWEYDGVGWVPLATQSSPVRRSNFASVFLPELTATLLFGGASLDLDPSKFRDTWLFRYQSDWPDEVCDNGVDDDGDGLADTADPDCP